MTYTFSHRADTEREIAERKRILEQRQDARMCLCEALGIELEILPQSTAENFRERKAHANIQGKR